MINITPHILRDNCSGSKIRRLFLVNAGSCCTPALSRALGARGAGPRALWCQRGLVQGEGNLFAAGFGSPASLCPASSPEFVHITFL